MAILSWGKCTIEYAASTNGAVSGSWTEIDTPKEDTTKLTTTEGTAVEAKEEGGDVVDARYSRNSYQLEFDLFVKKNEDAPFEDEDGVVEGNFGWRVTPEDKACHGLLIENSTLHVTISYATAEGILLHHVIKCLKPAEGNTVKDYVAGE